MDSKAHDTPSEVAADDGLVIVDGPDGVAVTLTPSAAEQTGERLLERAAEANGQRIVGDLARRQARRSS